ncbi:PREDICTED: cysteine-rich receptor-like protein kinase 6 isoform X1 [Camelina sativa]|uniref:Cysteine-rich receptor-like protein kinase 6 isoform X1 n=1 Tax=Camelina sativa TaxID=90675 RepID=A0ABM0U072_CAMSA|nr:PREDICTED: cysteine-rich receptor-like protein kinase 6 isoform X1 [Camelina sativa]
MSSLVSFISLFLFSFLTIFRASAQNPYYIYHNCPNTTTYTSNSTYFTNLRTVLSSLSSRNVPYSTRFQNATVGQAPNRVTGLFLCRRDYSPEVCHSCVTFAVNETLTRCPNEREVVIYYDECMLRYSYKSILSTVTHEGRLLMMNTNNISSIQNQIDGFISFVSFATRKASIEAGNSARKFSTVKTALTAYQTLYGLLQCTPDLKIQDCIDCLQSCIDGMELKKIGGRLFWPSCSVRYELYPFYNESAIQTPPPPPLGSSVATPPMKSPSSSGKGLNSKSRLLLVVAIVILIIAAVLLSIAGYCFLAKRKKKTYDTAPPSDSEVGDDMKAADSLQLDYRTIQTATNNFAEGNKIGKGGFGEVYKGTFSNGKEVAVKRLSKNSRQGEAEFKTEVVVVAKLQHRNLVRLLGFSLQGDERILVYEYMPNKSLDYLLFEPTKQVQLDWTQRYKIIGGIARGILYLHEDSQLKIIHRDLKASNILLDVDINPKIADFGMARIFGLDQTQDNTSRIVGTYGYMSPEYAMHGQFSMKSDVYSFGVLVLEIISGRKNSSFGEADGAQDLLTHAWRLWNNKAALALVDPLIVDSCHNSEVVRCIHIGLLCVQEDPVKRPTISTIFMMLTSNTVTLPLPRQPGFFIQGRPEKNLHGSDQSTTDKSGSIDDSSITDLYPR